MKIELTPFEILKLDGACAPETQIIVDDVKVACRHVRAANEIAVVVAARAGARQWKALRWAPTSIDHCMICNRSGGYALHTRGIDKGKPNHAKPLAFAGVDLSASWLHVRRHASIGGCLDCMTAIRPGIAEALADLIVELPDQLRAPGVPRRKRWQDRRCECCGWEGHEGQMRMRWSPSGRFPGGCPACPNESFDKIPRRDSYSVVLVDEAKVD